MRGVIVTKIFLEDLFNSIPDLAAVYVDDKFTYDTEAPEFVLHSYVKLKLVGVLERLHEFYGTTAVRIYPAVGDGHILLEGRQKLWQRNEGIAPCVGAQVLI